MTYRIMIRSGVNSRDGESSKEVEACWERRELEKPDSLKSSIHLSIKPRVESKMSLLLVLYFPILAKVYFIMRVN